MKVTPLPINGAYVIEHDRHHDNRGWFQEWYTDSIFQNLEDFAPYQANISYSRIGVIRGIHYSLAPEGQAKLVTVMSGAINDYVVDIRPDSPTFGKYERIYINNSIGVSLFIGSGLGHAFQAIEDHTVVSYLLSSEYNPNVEFGISPMCPDINIPWDINNTMSEKDLSAPYLKDALLML